MKANPLLLTKTTGNVIECSQGLDFSVSNPGYPLTRAVFSDLAQEILVSPATSNWRDYVHFDLPRINLTRLVPWNESSDWPWSQDKDVLVESLDHDEFRLLKSIPVKMRTSGPENVMASFLEGNISISGIDDDDAFQALRIEIVETYKTLLTERKLGPSADRQLQILRQYIAKK